MFWSKYKIVEINNGYAIRKGYFSFYEYLALDNDFWWTTPYAEKYCVTRNKELIYEKYLKLTNKTKTRPIYGKDVTDDFKVQVAEYKLGGVNESNI